VTKLFAVGFLLVGAAALAAEPPRVTFVSIDAAKIRGLSLESDEAAVRLALGSPTKETAGHDDAADAPSKELIFQGLTVYLVNNEVYRITCKAKGYATPAGIQVGDERQKVLSVYGPASAFGHTDEVLSYGIKGSDAWLEFRIREKRVVEIRLWFDYA